MKLIFARWSAWFNQLKYPQKFTIISLLFLLPLLAFFPIMAEQGTRIQQYGYYELYGNYYIRPLQDLLEHVQEYRRTEEDIRQNDATEAELTAIAEKINRDFASLENYHNQYADELNLDTQLTDLQAQWNIAQNTTGESSVPELDVAYRQLETDIQNLITYVGDSSFLILDPELETYYLMDVLLLQMPRKQTLLDQIRDIATKATRDGFMTINDRALLLYRTNQMQSELAVLEASLNKSGLISDEDSLIQDYSQATTSLLYYVVVYNQAILPETVTLSQFNELADEVQRTQSLLYDDLSIALENGIKDRINRYSLRIYIPGGIALFSLLIGFWFGLSIMRKISLPLTELAQVAQNLAAGDLSTRVAVVTDDEVGTVGHAFNQMGQALQSSQARLVERARAITISAEISRRLSTILDPDQLILEVVEQVKSAYNYYHAHIYLLDEGGQTLKMVGGTGDVGKILLAQGHAITMGRGVVGRAALSKRGVLVPDTSKEPGWVSNPLLPDTKAEIAVPILLRDQVIGVLDVQDDVTDDVFTEDVELLQAIANQVAVALQNARQYQETQQLFLGGQVLAAATDYQTMLNAIMVYGTLQADQGGLLIFNYSESGQLVTVEYAAAWSRQPDQPQPEQVGTIYTPEQVPFFTALLSDRPLIITDINQYQTSAGLFSTELAALLTAFGMQSLATLPLILGQQRLGAVMLGYRQPHVFGESELQPAQTLSNQIAILLQNQRLLAETRSTLQQLDMINRRLTTEAWQEFAHLTGKLVVSDGAQGTSVQNVGAELTVPIQVRGAEIGQFTVQQQNPDATFSAADRDLLQEVADEVAVALENMRLVEQTQQNAAALEESRNLLNSIIENLPVLLFVKDAQELRYVTWNKAGEELLGISAAEVLGKNAYDQFTQEEADRFTDQDRQILSGANYLDIAEETVNTPRGVRILHTRKTPVYSLDGTPQFLIGLSEDITERKQAEKALQELESLYRRAIAAADAVPYSRSYKDEAFAFIGEGIEHLTGYPVEQFTAQLFDTIILENVIHRDLGTEHAAAVELVRSGKVAHWKADYLIRTRDGAERWLADTSVEVLGPDGLSTGSVGILTDITERKRTEQALNRQLVETEALNTLGLILTSQNDMDDMLVQVGQHICTTFAVNTGSITLYDTHSQATRVPFALEAGVLRHDASLPAENDLLTQIINSREPLLISGRNPDRLRESGFHNLPSELPACWLGVPVLSNEQLIGIITLQHADQPDWFKESDARLLTTMANSLSTAIQNIRLFTQTQNALAELEALTRRLTHEGWQSYLTETTQEKIAYLYEGDRLVPVGPGDTRYTLEQNGSGLPLQNGQAWIQPMMIHGEEIGRLIAEDVDIEMEEFQAVIKAVSQGLSTHLDNLRLNEQTERALAEARQRTIEVNTLNELGQALAMANQVDEIVRHVRHYLPQLVPANDFYVALNHPDTNEVEIQVFINGEEISHFRRDLSNGVTEYILRTREKLFISGNLSAVAQKKGFQVIGRETAAYVGVPMISGQDVIGVIAMQSEADPNQFTLAHMELLSSVANQVAISLNNIALLAQTEARATELALINRVVSAVSASLDIRQSLQVVADELSRALQVEQTGIALLSEDHQSLMVVAETFNADHSASALGFVIPIAGNLSTEEVIRTRRPLIITDPMTSPLTAAFHDGLRMRQVQNLTILPILVGNEVIGTVGIDILEPGRVLSQQQIYLAETIVYQAAIAIENVRLFEQTESALQEVRTLFEMSVQLNATRTLAEMLEALTKTARDAGAETARLFTLELNERDEPEWGVVAAAWSQSYEPTPVGTRLPWNQFAPQQFWADNPNTVLFVGDVSQDTHLDTNLRQAYLQAAEKAVIWLPLTSQRRWLGMAIITWSDTRSYKLAEQRLYESLRTQASTIMENRLLYEQSQARAAELAVINQVAETVARELDAQRVMEIVYEKVQRIMITDAFLIGLYNTETDQITYPILYDQGERHSPPPVTRNAQSHAFQVVDTGQPLLINLTQEQRQQSLSARPTVGGTEYPASFIYVPMFTGTLVTGVMSVQSYEPDAYDQGDVELLMGIANYVSVSLENARLFTQTQARAAELTTLNEMSQISSSQLTLTGLINAVGEQLEKTFQTTGVYLALYDKEHEQISFPYFMETDDGERKLVNIPPRNLSDPGITGRIITTGQPVLVTQDTSTTMLQLGATTTDSGAGEVAAYLGVPMIVGDEVIGVIALQNDAGLRLFTEADQRLLMTLATTIGVAVRNAQQYESTRRRAQRERLLNEITQKIQGTHSMEGALQMAVKELGQALKAKYARVEIAAAAESPTNGKNGV